MIKKYLVSLFVLFCVGSIGLSAQLIKDVRDFLTDSLNVETKQSVHADSDSINKVEMQRQLQAAQVNEANMKLEIQNLRMQLISGDSLKRSQQQHIIDSLRKVSKGIPVVVSGDTLFMIYSRNGSLTPVERAQIDMHAIEELGKKMQLRPDSVYIENTDDVSDLMYKKKIIVSITNNDAMWMNKSREQLAEDYRTIVVAKLVKMHRQHSFWQWVKRISLFLLVIVGQYILFRLTKWLYLKAKVRIAKLKDTKLKAFSVQDYELLDTEKQVKIIIFFADVVRWILVIIQLLISIPLIFSIFPKTKKFAFTILSYVWEPIKDIARAVVDYIPNLFTIFIIWFAVKYLVKLVRYLATEVDSGRLRLGSFYADWAMPTYHIARFLLYAFMIAMIYPYLPGSKSGVFQGISVFIGLIVSLGSSTVIGNIIAGLVITYMRSFNVGDRIKLNDTVGNVIEKTPLVTRVKTPKNEIVTIPNSFMMSTQTVNFSNSAREYGLIIHSEVTIGYDAPWRKVHQLLIDAALDTPGVLQDPKPFVLETSLSDFYPVYQINAYIKEADKMPRIYSALHQNIQDHFNAGGVEILSPHYQAYRDGNETTIPKDDLRNTMAPSAGQSAPVKPADYPPFDK